ncbi:hypothetical protein ACFPRL_21005 [Pseudoclavibacter helvolus]
MGAGLRCDGRSHDAARRVCRWTGNRQPSVCARSVRLPTRCATRFATCYSRPRPREVRPPSSCAG